MPVTRDIVATYRGPRRVVRRLLDMGVREDRALVILVGACVVVFVAQWPRLAREAHLTDQALNPLLGGALLGWLFIAPLLFYVLALLSHGVARLARGHGTGLWRASCAFLGVSRGQPAHPAARAGGGVRRTGCRACNWSVSSGVVFSAGSGYPAFMRRNGAENDT